SQQVGSEIYYPIPLHLQECYRFLGYAAGSLPETEKAAREILHLPIYPELSSAEQRQVVASIGAFYGKAELRQAA
ncbi:MAG: DegT/DnrJ/EryC1/StrS family aminotransferase, partial [Pirellulaceae bacterium]